MTSSSKDTTGAEPLHFGRRILGLWRTLIVVTLVSLLIWLFAEGQSLTDASQAVRIDFVDESGERIVRASGEGWTGVVRVAIEGAAAAVDDAKAWLGEGIDIPLGVVGVPSAEGEQQVVDLRVALRNLEQFESAGIRVTDVDPATVRLDIEALVTLPETPVAVELTGVQLEEPARATPQVVSVRGPRSVIEQLQDLPGGPRVVARLSEEVLRGVQTGAQVTEEVAIRLPPPLTGARGVRIRPEKAELTFSVRSRTATATISAPVWAIMPPFEMDRWRIEIDERDQILQNLTLTGPGDVIARIEQGEIPVIAAVSLSSDELDRGVTSKTPIFWNLPPGVSVESVDGPVRFTIERREQEPAPAQ